MMTFQSLKGVLAIVILCACYNLQSQEVAIPSAWSAKIDGHRAVMIVTDGYFSIAHYTADDHAFISTEGGMWSVTLGDQVQVQWEFNTQDTAKVGQTEYWNGDYDGYDLTLEGQTWKPVDSGGPGALAGAWMITGRQRDGALVPMRRGSRITMKILSGTRFQWIAYDTSTKKFSGTGGGTYTTEGGKYVETIDFFSRDKTRVGAVLPFDFELKDGDWHHSGLSSKGAAIYEVWSQRE